VDGRSKPTVTGHWRAELERRDSPELFALAEQVEHLRSDPGFKAVMDLVGRGRENILDALTNGPTRDQADYARTVGYAAGLGELANALAAIEQVAEKRQKKLEARGEAERTPEPEEAT
jgi:hypothetical protein